MTGGFITGMQGWFNIWKSVNIIYYINRLKEKKNTKPCDHTNQFSSVQSSVMSYSLWPHEPQHARPPCHYQLPEFTQTHLHRVDDTIQPSHPLSPPLLLPSIFPNISVFSNESPLCIRWPKCWSFSSSPSKAYSGLISLGLTCLISLQFKELSRVFSNTTVQKHQFFDAQPSSWSNS